MDKYRVIISDNLSLTIEADDFEIMAETNNLYFNNSDGDCIAGFHMPQIKGFNKTERGGVKCK